MLSINTRIAAEPPSEQEGRGSTSSIPHGILVQPLSGEGGCSRLRFYRLPTGKILQHSTIMENFVCLCRNLGIRAQLLQDLDRCSRSPKQQDSPPCPALKALSKEPFPISATNDPAIINVALNLTGIRHKRSHLRLLLVRLACVYSKMTVMLWLL